jgi:hypothetical protein
MSQYYPVCAGYTANDEKIVLYQDDQKQNHIQLPNGELWALGPKYIIETIFDIVKAEFHVKLESPQWTGTFTGTQKDLFEAEPR